MRSLAQITTFDFVVLLIVGEATQQALLGDDFSFTNGCLVILTLVMNVGFDALKSWSPKVDRWLEDLPIVIVKDGKPIRERMQMVNVEVEDILESARNRQGLRGTDEIAYAVLERNGEISVIPRDDN